MPDGYGADQRTVFARCPHGGLTCPNGLAAAPKGAAMEFGWYHEFHRQVGGQSDAEAFDQGFYQGEDPDRWGLEGFCFGASHLPSGPSVLIMPVYVCGPIAGSP